ncbi:MAG: hypothetical protein COA80_08535, partial [Leeuwenhoekiella sp.]
MRAPNELARQRLCHALQYFGQDVARGGEVDADEALAGFAEARAGAEPDLGMLFEPALGRKVESEFAAVEPREVGRLGLVVAHARQLVADEVGEEV